MTNSTTDCWTWRPVVDGKQLQEEYGVPRGPAVGQAIEAQTLWRLEHPRSSRHRWSC